MQTLKKQIIYKLQIINKNSNQQEQEYKRRFTLGQLLEMKKRQLANQITEERLIHNFLQTRIDQSLVQSFYSDSLYIMKKYDSDFIEPLLDKKKNNNLRYSSPIKQRRSIEEKSVQVYQRTVNLYAKFFKEQNGEQRCNEILYMFQKNICEKEALLPTLFSWLFQWIRKRFMEFLKSRLSEVDNKAQRIELMKKKRIKMMSQISPESNSQFKSQQPIKIEKKSSLTKEKSSNSINKEIIDISPIKSLQLMHEDSISKINSGETINYTNNPKNLKEQSWFFVTKETLLGVIHQDLETFYEYHGDVIQDLDLGMLKNLRKAPTRKLSMLIHIDKIVQTICSKQLVNFKKSISTYSRAWKDKFSKENPDSLKSISSSRNLEKKRTIKGNTRKKRQEVIYQSYSKFLQSKDITSSEPIPEKKQKIEASTNVDNQVVTQRYEDKILQQQQEQQYRYCQSESLLLKFPKKQKVKLLQSPDRYRQPKSRIFKKRENALSFQQLSSSRLQDEFKNINRYLQVIKIDKGITETVSNNYGPFKKSYKSKIQQDPMKKQLIYNMLKAVGLKQPKRSNSLIEADQQKSYMDEYIRLQKVEKVGNGKGVFYLPKIN